MIVNASIEARMTSSRLPGKVLLAIKGKPSLQLMIERVRQCKLINNIIVATTINKTDDPIIELCEQLHVKYYRGSENDVLQRVLDAHKKFKSDVIVELTGDCPLIDPRIIDQCIECYINNNYDYVSNDLVRSFPMGMDVEIFSVKILEEVSKLTSNPSDREHVSPYIYKSGKYTTYTIKSEPDLNWPDLAITLDTEADYNVIKKIFEHFNDNSFSLKDILSFIRNNSVIIEENKHIIRTGVDV